MMEERMRERRKNVRWNVALSVNKRNQHKHQTGEKLKSGDERRRQQKLGGGGGGGRERERQRDREREQQQQKLEGGRERERQRDRQREQQQQKLGGGGGGGRRGEQKFVLANCVTCEVSLINRSVNRLNELYFRTLHILSKIESSFFLSLMLQNAIPRIARVPQSNQSR